MIDALNSNARCLTDLLKIDKVYFEQIVSTKQIWLNQTIVLRVELIHQ